MHKTKKKTAKLPKPIKVKKEKSDEDRLPQPMSHYIDDRLELVKQVFGTLKPKTIINLAPEFLKSQGLEDIEEACLNELLCISTKRLKSIITATKCPSDTESSDDNDDEVQRQEERVSLEEISSDSEIEGGKKAKKKRSSKIVDKDKPNAKTEKSKTNESGCNPEDGQISVLELLELQARARAIRSQLALEPVTKIEVESEGEETARDERQKSKKDKKPQKSSERKRISSTRESQDSSNATSKSTELEPERKAKKIKLKRNYRNASSSATQAREEEDNDKPKNSAAPGENEGNKMQEIKPANEKVKKEKSSRSVSPDVIPIVAEPETLLINDSSDEAEVKDSQAAHKTAEAIEKESTNENSVLEKTDKTVDIASEPEEGELATMAEEAPNPEPDESSKEDKDLEKEQANRKDESKTSNSLLPKNTGGSDDSKEANDIEKPASSEQPPSSSSIILNESSVDIEEDEDQNDDVISLGEDLEDEMNEQFENEENRSTFKVEDNTEVTSSETMKEKMRKEKSNEDNQKEENQSWHSRYMKSSKVSKVLAASRLGKRVRDKIKKSKDAPRENVDSEKVEPVFSSKHEDGSLDQYKELLELRNRKSK